MNGKPNRTKTKGKVRLNKRALSVLDVDSTHMVARQKHGRAGVVNINVTTPRLGISLADNYRAALTIASRVNGVTTFVVRGGAHCQKGGV